MSTIAVTDFKAHLSSWLDQVEHHHQTVELVRHGHVIARIVPATPIEDWKTLRKKGRLTIQPGDSILSADDFEALS